jgi:hypothetical protein
VQDVASRRQALFGVAAAGLVLAPRNANAFLGIGDDTGKIYNDETVRSAAVENYPDDTWLQQ